MDRVLLAALSRLLLALDVGVPGHSPVASLTIRQATRRSAARGHPPNAELALSARRVYGHHTRRTQEAVIDYDSPRRPPIEDDDGLDELKVREPARSPTADLDDVEHADGVELPDADMSGEELTVPVLPIRADELRCSRCFLVQHRSRFTARVNGQEICLECA